MSERFEDRVKRLFGSQLFETVPKSSFPTSSWSVADGEVERREWNRERARDDDDDGDGRGRDDDPCSSAFYDKGGCLFKSKRGRRDKQREFEGDLGDLDDDDDDDDEGETERGREGEDEEEREIRSSVGLDPTLDNEDEEDMFDRAAVGKENAAERVYMRDVKNHGSHINYHSVVPDSLDEPSDEDNPFSKDPRADHFAASLRLKEDKTANGSHPPFPLSKSPPKTTETDTNPKPILKRKEVQADTKPKKRVRFDPLYIDDNHEVSEVLQDTETGAMPEESASVPQVSPGIPDYLRNPSKYTRYTLDSPESNDEETNRRAFEDFRNLVKGSKPENLQPDFPIELPKSVTFTPRRKSVDVVPMDDSPVNNTKERGHVSDTSVRVAAVEVNDDETCEMDEDDPEVLAVDATMSSRGGRHYRSKSMADSPS